MRSSVQRRVPAPRDLPERLAMKVCPRPVRVPAARLRRPMYNCINKNKKFHVLSINLAMAQLLPSRFPPREARDFPSPCLVSFGAARIHTARSEHNKIKK
jgi:hypothetical protein